MLGRRTNLSINNPWIFLLNGFCSAQLQERQEEKKEQVQDKHVVQRPPK